MKKNDKVLGDHQRHKNKFIPPLEYKLGGIKETSWIKHGIPELIWLSILNYRHGIKDGTEIALQFTKECVEQCSLEPKPFIASISSFSKLTSAEKSNLVAKLGKTGLLDQLLESLGGLLAHYPKCPLSFIATKEQLEEYSHPTEVEILKKILEPLFYKLEKEAVFTQATFFYLGLVQGKMHVTEGLALAHFPKIEEYPNTEISKQIASGVRATVSLLFGGIGDDAP